MAKKATGKAGGFQLNFSKSEIAKIEKQAVKEGFGNYSDYLMHLHNLHIKSVPKKSSNTKSVSKKKHTPIFKTEHGNIYQGDSSILLPNLVKKESVDLIVTSPPFGLVRKKDYGNEDADRYVRWFQDFAQVFATVLKPNGSLVIDIGGAWKKGEPTRSLYHYELLIMLCRQYGFKLAQEFFWWNPAKLPTPAEWVNVRRVRVKDAVNCVFWLSKTAYPKANNRRVLQPYSESMKGLLKNGYQPRLRPSGHDISSKFKVDNKGAIPPNLLALANTKSNGVYQRFCKDNDIKIHPARFPNGLPAFFIRMLTEPGDVVVDPFAGSCITGLVAEKMNRKWICIEKESEYIKGAKARFEDVDQESIMGSSNYKPYQIFPPTLDIFSENETPLIKDGGKERP